MGTNTMALIQTCQIQAIMTVPKRLFFSARLTNCNVGPCWHVELCTLSLLHLSYNIHSSKGFSCSIEFLHLKITLGLALGESWVACATTEKHWCPVSTFSYCRGKAFLGKPATVTFGRVCPQWDAVAEKVAGKWTAVKRAKLCLQDEVETIDTTRIALSGDEFDKGGTKRQAEPVPLVPCRSEPSNWNLATCWHISWHFC